jgi:hypothetical protein
MGSQPRFYIFIDILHSQNHGRFLANGVGVASRRRRRKKFFEQR